MKQRIKHLLFGSGTRPKRLLFGPGAGMWMNLDLAHQTQRYLGLDEWELMVWLRRWLPGVRSCIDVGANDGYYTMLFLASGAERVVACEPGPAADALVENARLNDWAGGDRLKVVRSLIGRAEGCVSLGELLKGIPRPVLVKVDVDGEEVNVLESVPAKAPLDDVFWIVETHSPELERACVGWFETRGYHPRIVKNAWWRVLLPERRGEVQNRWLVCDGGA